MLIHKIDELTEGDHYHITSNSNCFYFLEYPSGDSTQNRGNPHYSFVHNFKKTVDRFGSREWQYKLDAIEFATNLFIEFFTFQKVIKKYTLIPIPPSKTRNNPLYDPRMTTALNGIKTVLPDADVRDLLINKKDLNSHRNRIRPSVSEIQDNYSFDSTLLSGVRKNVILFDDVLVSGAHYCAAKNKLHSILPELDVKGIFIARRVFPNSLEENNKE